MTGAFNCGFLTSWIIETCDGSCVAMTIGCGFASALLNATELYEVSVGCD